MEPLINPWLIYGLEVLQGLRFAVGFILVLALTATSFWSFSNFVEPGCFKLRPIRISAVALILSAAFLVVTPSKNTVIKMYAASQITEDRLAQAGEYVEDLREAVKSDLIEILNATKDEK